MHQEYQQHNLTGRRSSKYEREMLGVGPEYAMGDLTNDLDKTEISGKMSSKDREEQEEILDHSDLYLNDPVVAAHYAKTGLGHGVPYNVPFGAYPGAYN